MNKTHNQKTAASLKLQCNFTKI